MRGQAWEPLFGRTRLVSNMIYSSDVSGKQPLSVRVSVVGAGWRRKLSRQLSDRTRVIFMLCSCFACGVLLFWRQIQGEIRDR